MKKKKLSSSVTDDVNLAQLVIVKDLVRFLTLLIGN
jgi:hypothetical protein